MSRQFDLVVYGATGFTGLLVCEYLAKQYGSDDNQVVWAMCGRSEEKLAKSKKYLMERVGDWCERIPTVIADSAAPESLEAMCEQTKVVLSTVGPYKAYGTPLVEACAKLGTDYCDITGEAHWVCEMIEKFHELARETGARLVSFCGYDSIPSDLGAFMLVDYSRKSNSELGPVTNLVGKSKGGFSGGTAASAILMFEKDTGGNVNTLRSDPYALCPSEGKTNVDGSVSYIPKRDKLTGKWRAPFLMSEVNSQVVRRSAWANSYGKNFSYSEYMLTGSAMKSSGVSGAFALAALVLSFKPTRNLVRKYLPEQGQGPTETQREKGYFNSYVHSLIGGKDVICHVHASGDPGYKATSIMVAESALALVASRLPENSKPEEKAGGYWTTSSCRGMGIQLLERLENAGVHFDLRDNFTTEDFRKLEAFL